MTHTETNIDTTLSGNTIGFIGAGNMAQAIIAGLIASGLTPSQIIASAKTTQSREKLANRFSIKTPTNAEVAAQSDILVLSVKPQVLQNVCKEISTHLKADVLVISVAAGITCQTLSGWLATDTLVRAMPNTPAAIGKGATGLYAQPTVTSEQKGRAQAIMRAVGVAEFVKSEDLIDVVTAISGSAPAYFFLFLEAMIDSAVDQGLDRQTATAFAMQTAVGAGQLAMASEHSIDELRKNVTSPKGTTEQALNTFENGNLRTLVDEAMHACVKRAKELSKELSSQ